MKVKRRKYNIFEQMERAFAENSNEGPIEEFILTPDEFQEVLLDAKNRTGMSFRKVIGRPGDVVGGDWSYRGAVITVSGKTKN